jgi:hypothetical protein
MHEQRMAWTQPPTRDAQILLPVLLALVFMLVLVWK